jgi:hypothetical protein
MLGMAAFLFSINIQAKKNVRLKLQLITTVKDSDGDKKVIQTKEVERSSNNSTKDANSKF